MHTKKVVSLLLITIFCLFTFAGCFDLGDYENDEDYISSFDEFTLTKIDGSTITKYSMEDFYNKEAINGFLKPMSIEDCSTYVYFYFKVEKTFKMGELAMYFNSTSPAELKISLFVLKKDELPTKLYDPESENDDSNEPSDDKIVASNTVALDGKSDGWKSVVFRSYLYNNNSVKDYPLFSGEYIVFRFDNNHYDFALREIDKMQKEVDILNIDYQSKKDVYDEKKSKFDNGDSSVSQSDVDNAKNEMDASLLVYNAKNTQLSEAKVEYEKQKAKYPQMAIRMTALLIRAQKEKK